MKIFNLVFKPALDGSLKVDFEDYGHSQNLLSSHLSLTAYLTHLTGETSADRYYNKSDVVMPYNENYIGEPNVYFRAPAINSAFPIRAFTGLSRQLPWICTQFRKQEDPKLIDDRFAPISFIKGMQQIGIDISKYDKKIFGSPSYYGGGDSPDKYGRYPITIMDFLARIMDDCGLISHYGFYFDLSFASAQEETDMERFMTNPTQYIVSEYNMKYRAIPIKEDPSAKVIEVPADITPETLQAIEAMASEDIQSLGTNIKLILQKFSYLGTSNKNLILAIYKTVAGFDDYDVQRALENAMREINMERSARDRMSQTVLTLLAITNYSGSNTSHYYSGTNDREASIQECMDNHNIERDELTIDYLEYSRIREWSQRLESTGCDKLFTLAYSKE